MTVYRVVKNNQIDFNHILLVVSEHATEALALEEVKRIEAKELKDVKDWCETNKQNLSFDIEDILYTEIPTPNGMKRMRLFEVCSLDIRE